MANVLDDLATHLQTQGLGTVGAQTNPPTSIRKGFLPPSPDEVIGLVEVEGEEPIDTIGSALNVEVLVIQAICRAATDDYEQSRTIAENVYRELHGIASTTLGGGARYLAIQARGGPSNLGEDNNGRWMIGVNFTVWKELN